MKQTGEGGFTLMELVVVMAIMLIVSAMVLPDFSRHLQEERFVSAVYQVHSDLRLAQEAAKREQYPVRVNFYTQDGRIVYRIYTLTTKRRLIKEGALPKGVQLSTRSASSVDFAQDGHALKNGHLLLYQGKMRRYIYFYQTGRVRISAQEI